jgi:hypothetical protein
LGSTLVLSRHAETQREGLHQIAQGYLSRCVGNDEAHRHPAGHLVHLDTHTPVKLPLHQLRL